MFPFWLDISSKKLEKAQIFDSKINIIFESIEKQKEEDKTKKNLIKYWFPRVFPERVNCIVTTLAGSPSDQYFSEENGVNCHRIYVKLKGENPGGMAQVLYENAYNKLCYNDFQEAIVEIWKKDLRGLGHFDDRTEKYIGGKGYMFTKIYFDLFLLKIDNSNQECNLFF